MNVYLLRHGPAEEPVAQPPPRGETSDLERALTDEGRAKTRRACGGLKRLGIAPKVILTSSAKRALQTAEIAARALSFNVPLTVSDQLCPGARPGSLLHLIEDSSGDVLVVGHEPDLSSFAALLLGIENPRALALSKAGAVGLEFSGPPRPGGARLLWFMRPKQLRKLAS